MKKSSRPDTKRPPNRRCKICGRKALSPEKIGGKWYFRSVQKCTNCIMLENNILDGISKRKRILIKSRKEEEAVFPLSVLDVSMNELVGKFEKSEDLRKKLDSYRIKNPNSKIMVIDRKYHDFTDIFIISSS